MWKNIVEPDRPQMTIWRLRFACWIPKSTDTHLENVILIPFPLQPRLQERVSVLRYTHIAYRDLFLRSPFRVFANVISVRTKLMLPLELISKVNLSVPHQSKCQPQSGV